MLPAWCLCLPERAVVRVLQVAILQAIDLEIIDMGTQPISLGGVKTYASNSDETMVETTAMWGSNARVRASARVGLGPFSIYIPVEVTDVQVLIVFLPRCSSCSYPGL